MRAPARAPKRLDMPGNPFITRESWRKDKVTYGIPDAVIKVSFGEELQKLYDKFEKSGLKGSMTLKKVPSDAKALQDLYSQGMRNHLGAVFHETLTTYKGGVARVSELLKDYEEGLKKWHSSMQGAGPSTIAKDPVKRKEFVEDMEKALKMGKEILDLTT